MNEVELKIRWAEDLGLWQADIKGDEVGKFSALWLTELFESIRHYIIERGIENDKTT